MGSHALSGRLSPGASRPVFCPKDGECWEDVLRGGKECGRHTDRRGMTCDDNVGTGSSCPSSADCYALVHAFFGLGGPRDLPAAVS